MPGNNNNDSNSTSNNNLNDSNGENSFYDDNNAQFGSRTTSEGTSLNGGSVTASGNTMKRPMSLDLNSSKNAAKKQRLNQSSIPTPVLESPDLQSLKFTTPDIEKFILSNNLLLTPTPGGNQFPQKVFNNFQVTTEQEGFAKGFVDALNSLRNNDNPQSHSNGTSGGSFTYTDLDVPYPPVIKEEPQTVPSSPPLSPIDMQDQEKIKLERKRQRNRVAASKCRKRKLERISKLEDKVKVLKSENTDLGSVIKQMKEHVMQLKQQVIDHIHAGCSVQLYNSSTVLQSK